MSRKPRFTITMDTTPRDLYTESINNLMKERTGIGRKGQGRMDKAAVSYIRSYTDMK